MMSFIRNLVGVKTDQALNQAIEAIVRWDPQSATEAELRTMEEHLDGLGRQVAEARMAFGREKKEADAIQALSQSRMAAAEILERQMHAEADAGRKAELERSLATLVGMLESMAPDLERERQDAADAEEFLRMLEQTYQQAGEKLKTARDALARAQRDMDRAAQQREIAENRAQAARVAAGLSGATSGISVALKAMQDNAARSLAEAEAANAKARLLAPAKPEQEDRNIAEALRAASGQPAAPSSLSDRLAALRGRQPAGRLLGGPGA